ncbi:MAG: ABC transporter permease [Pseudomonadota bacterium]
MSESSDGRSGPRSGPPTLPYPRRGETTGRPEGPYSSDGFADPRTLPLPGQAGEHPRSQGLPALQAPAYDAPRGAPTAAPGENVGAPGAAASGGAQAAGQATHVPRSPDELSPPTGAPPPAAAAAATGSAAAGDRARGGQPRLSIPDGNGAPTKAARRVERTRAPIVPPEKVTGQSLTLVIAIMCFLACLTAGAVYMINQSASAWLRDIASEVSVQVEPRNNTNTAQVIRNVTNLLRRTPGIESARILSVDDSAKLLEPWLGQSDILKTLPVPRIIALQLDRNAPPDLDALRQTLATRFTAVTLDDHRHWQKQIRTVTGSFALGGFAILVLVCLATTAIIVSATRSSMASNREIVEVLHFVGATDKYIAGEFERHFLRLGIKAGLIGAGCAIAVFLAIPLIMNLLGGGSITAVELQRLVGSGTLDVFGYAYLGVVVVVIATLCMMTSRIGVFRMLNSQRN